MANYYGKKPLRLTCPHCGSYDEHPVTNTHQRPYHWGKPRTAFFKRIAGKDISYRLRSKKCVSCQHSFRSVEMPFMFLDKLMGEVERLETVTEKLRNIARNAGRKLVRAADGPTRRPKRA
jgi:hypothetical protein